MQPSWHFFRIYTCGNGQAALISRMTHDNYVDDLETDVKMVSADLNRDRERTCHTANQEASNESEQEICWRGLERAAAHTTFPTRGKLRCKTSTRNLSLILLKTSAFLMNTHINVTARACRRIQIVCTTNIHPPTNICKV